MELMHTQSRNPWAACADGRRRTGVRLSACLHYGDPGGSTPYPSQGLTSFVRDCSHLRQAASGSGARRGEGRADPGRLGPSLAAVLAYFRFHDAVKRAYALHAGDSTCLLCSHNKASRAMLRLRCIRESPSRLRFTCVSCVSQ